MWGCNVQFLVDYCFWIKTYRPIPNSQRSRCSPHTPNMALPITTLFSDCHIKCVDPDCRKVSVHKYVLHARAPKVKIVELTGYSYVDFTKYTYNDVNYAVKCLYDNDVTTAPTHKQLQVLQEFGNNELMTKALSMYIPSPDEIRQYDNNDIDEKYRQHYNNAIANQLRALMNSKSEHRDIAFSMDAVMLKLAFSDEDALTAESITYIRKECLSYMNKKLDDGPSFMSVASSIVYFMTLLV